MGAPRLAVPAGVGAAAPHHLQPVLPSAEPSPGETERSQHGIEMIETDAHGPRRRASEGGGRRAHLGLGDGVEADEREADAGEEAPAVPAAAIIVLAAAWGHEGGARIGGRERGRG